MKKIVGFLALAMLLVACSSSAPEESPLFAQAISIKRAELSGGELRVEGSGAAAGARVTVTSPESTASSNADSKGDFRIRTAGFTSSTCEATVSDGVSSLQVRLSGCTPSEPSDPDPGPSDPEPEEPEPEEPEPSDPEPSDPEPSDPKPAEPRISSLTFDPSPIPGGEPATGIVTFTRALDEDTLVSLSSGLPQFASVPSQVIAPAGATQITFPVETSPPEVDRTFTMFATAFAVTRTTSLTVLAPPPPPDADTVRITRAEYKNSVLRVEATSTSSNATLAVYHLSGSRIFTLTNLGSGKYRGEQPLRVSPSTILVSSSLGGSDTANVTMK